MAPTTRSSQLHRCLGARASSQDYLKLNSLPDELLVEILCRLPCNKLVSQCKCVCKRWFLLLSNPDIVGRFVCLQKDKKNPSTCGMLFSLFFAQKDHEIAFFAQSSQFPESLTSSLSTMSFIPCFDPKCAWMNDVLSVYNDLVLCHWGYSPNESSAYYIICNPYTRQWVALPPAPVCLDILPAELICDPYCKFPEDDNKSCEQNIIVNAEYRCKVVRFHLYLLDPFRCEMDMFSSDTGVWQEFVVVSPREFTVYCNDAYPRAGFPYKGKLYWAGTGGVMALDPLAYNGNNSSSACDGREIFNKCYFVELDEVKLPVHLNKFVCESRGMICLVALRRIYEDVHIWEMKGDVEDGCCFSIRQRVCLLPRMERSGLWHWLYNDREATKLLPLDSFDEDVMYLQSRGSIFMCNVRTRKILKITNKRFNTQEVTRVLPFVLPWWPTPVPKMVSVTIPPQDAISS